MQHLLQHGNEARDLFAGWAVNSLWSCKSRVGITGSTSFYQSLAVIPYLQTPGFQTPKHCTGLIQPCSPRISFSLQCIFHLTGLHNEVKPLSVDKRPCLEVVDLFTHCLLVHLVLLWGAGMHQQSQDLKEKRMERKWCRSREENPKDKHLIAPIKCCLFYTLMINQTSHPSVQELNIQVPPQAQTK